MSPKPKYYETNDFKRLEEDWNKKLKASGFEDAEQVVNGERVLKQNAPNSYRQADELTRQSKLDYFLLIGKRTQDEDFEVPHHKFIMEAYSNGRKIKDIVAAIQATGGKISRWTVRYIIRRYENKWEIKSWTNKQMNLKQGIK